MKELSIVKQMVADGQISQEVAEKYFPELKKCGDELTWLKRFIQEEIDCLSFDIRDSEDRVKLKNLQRSFSWLKKQGEQNVLQTPTREMILAVWELGNIWKELTHRICTTKYGTQLDYIQKHWQESKYYLKAKQDEQKHAEEYNITGIDSKNAQGKLGEMIKNIKPSWSEDDERIYQSIMDDIVQENQLNDKQTNWLKDIKYRYFPQPRQEWSEEDERIYNRICDIVHAAAFANYDVDENGKECGEYAKIIGWFKSLKDRVQPKNTWKPSDEQMEALYEANTVMYGGGNYHLTSLYNDLKKLKA